MTSTKRSSFLASSAVRLAGLYLLAGAIAKLLYGTPVDLPRIVLDAGPTDPAITFKLVIAAELAVAGAGLVAPRIGWTLLSLVLVAFLGVLTSQVVQGAESCGCFGKSITIAPEIMLGADAALLLLVLATRPWRAFRERPLGAFARALLIPAVLAGVATPWAYFASQPTGEGGTPKEERFVTLLPHDWNGKALRETPLARWIDLEQIPDEGTFIFYRNSCEVCAKHLQELAAKDDPNAFYTLIRVPGDEGERQHVREKPNALADVTLPKSTVWVIQTPMEMQVEGGIVRGAKIIAH